jgi:hypothetical protein
MQRSNPKQKTSAARRVRANAGSSGANALPPRIELVRAEDLLHLQVEFVNLRLDDSTPEEPMLLVKDAAQPAYLIFIFPPQTITESAFFEATIVTPDGDPKKPPDPDASQPSTYREPLPPPGFPAPTARRVALLGHPSRLAFIVPAEANISFSLEGLLDWSKLTLSVNGIAAVGKDPSADEIANAPAIKQPDPTETAIELPYQLVISPNRKVAWLHRSRPFTSRGRTELWHTRLALKSGDEITELAKDNLAPLRAIWSADYDPRGQLPAVEDDPDLGRTAMNKNDRHQIVVLTSAFHGYEVKRKFFPYWIGDRLVGIRPEFKLSRMVPYVPAPFEADRLMLSSLGGWLRSRGQWDPPQKAPAVKPFRPDYEVIFKNAPLLRQRARAPEIVAESIAPILPLIPRPTPVLDLSEWVHLVTQGRDHYVRIVYEGELWPFRHPAALIKITERKFQETNGIVGAYLMQHMFIIVRKPDKRSPPNDYGNPFKRVVLTTTVTPDIADPKYVIPGHRAFWVEVMTGPAASDRSYFNFHGVGYDGEGKPMDATAPMMFVSRGELGLSGDDPDAALLAAYNAKASIPMRTLSIPGQKMLFAERAGNNNTELVTESLNFIMDTATVRPTLLKAAVRIPQVQELLGNNKPVSIRLYPEYVKNGFEAGNTTGVFAQIVQEDYSELNVDPSIGLAKSQVDINAEKAGGIATPNLGVTTLSRQLGPLAGKVEDAVTNTFDPAQFFPKGAAMLFGSFDLVDLFLPKLEPGQVPTPLTLGKNAPKLTIENTGAAIVTKLDWQPEFLEPSKKLDLKIAAIKKDRNGIKSVLDIQGTITKAIGAGEPSTVFKGSLDSFTVSVLGSVFINFDRFSFTKVDNKKPDVTVKLDADEPLLFDGDLRFIEEIREAIPAGLFGEGASLDLVKSPLGIRAGFAFALPPLTVGVFTLKDVKLGAGLTLPFLEGKPSFDFNISERAHPFLLAVAIFGGGGFFHLQLDTAGMKALEVSLEFGAAAALDIGVASGEVHIMAGIYFSLQRKEGSADLAAILSGYLRMGGSLEVLGIVKVSVEFNLSFTYDGDRDKAYGRATLTVAIEVFMFSVSVELTVERAFGGSGDPHFIDFFPSAQPWEEYALAFA